MNPFVLEGMYTCIAKRELITGLDNFEAPQPQCQSYVIQGENRYFRHSHISEAKFG